jgi:DNA-binding ferritin-like protein
MIGGSGADEGNEFADFMADISQEIAERVQSLEPPPEPTPAAAPKRAVSKPDPNVITDWEEVADRMIEEMR